MADNSNNPTIQDSRRAAAGFLRAGRRAERVRQQGDDNGFALSERFNSMSDEDFDKAVAEGTITPEQLRKAGEYRYDVYMGDVWSEHNDDEPEPTYDEFISEPEKYGYTPGENDTWRFHRYNPNRYRK